DKVDAAKQENTEDHQAGQDYAAQEDSQLIAEDIDTENILSDRLFSSVATPDDGNRYTVLLLDTSGSMTTDILLILKQAASRFCEQMQEADGINYISVVSYSSSVNKTYDFTKNLDDLESQINGLTANGDTNINAALLTAADILSVAPKEANKNIVLFSDGLPNKGNTLSTGRYTSSDHSNYKYGNAVYNTAKEMDSSWNIYTLGFFQKLSDNNLSFARKLMQDIQNKGYFEVTNADELSFAFDKVVSGITADDLEVPEIDYLEVGLGGDVFVHWKSPVQNSYIKGFQVQHRIAGTSVPMTTRVEGAGTTSCKLSALSYNDYQIRICSYATEEDKTVTSEWSAWAECPVKEIKFKNPINGSQIADSLGFVGEIDFGNQIDNFKGTFSIRNTETGEIFDTSKINFSTLSFPEEAEVDSSFLKINAYNMLNLKNAANPEPNWFKPGTSYSIGISKKAVEYLHDNEPYSPHVYFAGISSPDVWTFKTTGISYSRLRNPENVLIPNEYYQKFYQPQDWADIQKIDDGSKGYCFGLCYAAAGYKGNYSKLKQLTNGYAQLSDVPVKDDFLKYIQMAQILQYRAYSTNKTNSNLNKRSDLVNAVKSGKNIIVGIKKDEKEGWHAVYPIGIYSENNNASNLAVYDCNGYGYLVDVSHTLNPSALGVMSFSSNYEQQKYGPFNNDITFQESSSRIDGEIKKVLSGGESHPIDEILISSTQKLINLSNQIEAQNGSDSDPETYLYWSDNPGYYYECNDDNVTLTISDGTNKIYTTLSSGMKMNFDISSLTASVDGNTEGPYKIRFSKADGYDSFHDFVVTESGEKKANGQVILKKIDGNLHIISAEKRNLRISVEENGKETKVIEFKSPGRELLIHDNGENLEIYADNNEDGVFDDLVNIESLKVIASGACGSGSNDVTWTLTGDGTLSFSGTGNMKDYSSGTAPWASFSGQIQAVAIENGISSIGAYAFYGCSLLTRADIAESVVKIGNDAFSNCSSLAKALIPSSVKSIGSYAFSNCNSLAYVTIPGGVTKIEGGTFKGCAKLTGITIPVGVETIGVSAFE
ncbi:MAG: leucine-rich repeat protein, partial [Oscillospiraceae bacterium]|nr:leucine-rich repeat protein [Oscillospiraceae bacterium]